MFTAIWVTLLAVGGLTECVALIRKDKGDTLSEHVWKWLRVGDARSTPVTWTSRVLVAVACLWLAGHFSMGWWS